MSLLKALLFGEKTENFLRTLSPSPPSSPCGSSLGEVPTSPAILEAEEVRFRLWWRTLPNKTMARQNWAAELAYYAAQKGLSKAVLEALKARVEDLWREGRT